jgi:predicted aspartyl protease
MSNPPRCPLCDNTNLKVTIAKTTIKCLGCETTFSLRVNKKDPTPIPTQMLKLLEKINCHTENKENKS